MAKQDRHTRQLATDDPSCCSTPSATYTSDCASTETEVNLSILTDDFPLETGWTIEDWQTETVVETGGPYQFTGASVTKDMCLPKGCYVLTMTDTIGDGLCCEYGTGS
jgi:hypothetical protein